MTVFIEFLSQHHGLIDRESETARSLLLQCGCGERRGRRAAQRMHPDISDAESCLRGGPAALFEQRRRTLFIRQAAGGLRLQFGSAGDGKKPCRDAVIRL